VPITTGNVSIGSFNAHCNSHATSHTKSSHASLFASPLQAVEQCHQDAAARGTYGMAESYGSTTHIHLRVGVDKQNKAESNKVVLLLES